MKKQLIKDNNNNHNSVHLEALETVMHIQVNKLK